VMVPAGLILFAQLATAQPAKIEDLMVQPPCLGNPILAGWYADPEVTATLVGVEIAVSFFEREHAGHRRHRHVPGVEHINGEFHAFGGWLAFVLRRLWQFEFPTARRLFAEIDEIIIGRAAAVFGMLAYVMRME